MNDTAEKSKMLRLALRGNGVFSLLSGSVFVVASTRISEVIGLEYPVILVVVGLGLVSFAGALFFNSARPEINRLEAAAAVVGDVAWVLGSGVVIALGVLTTTGNWAVAVVAEVVLLFAILQYVGIRRVSRV